MKTYTLPWHCNKCKAQGLLRFFDGDDIGLIELSIEKAHYEQSPRCSEWYSQLKVGLQEKQSA